MGIERTVIDTSALYALASDKDEFHHRAGLTFQELIDDEVQLFVSSYALVETIALMSRRMGQPKTGVFIEAIKDNLYVIWVGKRTHWQAWDSYRSQKSQGLSYVDCTTLLLAKDLGATVFTFDEDFVKQAIPVIPQNPRG